MTEAAPELPREALALLRARGGHACLDPETLVALARGTLDPARRDEALAEVARCGDCARALQFAIDAESLAESLAASLQPPTRGSRTTFEGTAPAHPRPAARPRGLRGLAIAASLLAAVGLGLSLLRPPAEDVLRGQPGEALEPQDGARVSAAPTRLAWRCESPQPVRVELRDEGAALVWQGDSETCSIDLPPAATLGAGTWLWQVRSPDGRLVAGPFQLHIE
ncbi:MAG: hypothetical protein ACOVKS_14700 [Aquimonas sp.]